MLITILQCETRDSGCYLVISQTNTFCYRLSLDDWHGDELIDHWIDRVTTHKTEKVKFHHIILHTLERSAYLSRDLMKVHFPRYKVDASIDSLPTKR